MPLVEELYGAITQALRRGEQVALATVVRVTGSTPREPGAQMLVYDDGRTLGSVGGGSLEAQVVSDAQAALATGQPALHAYSLHAEEPAALGACGGRMEVFVHVLRPTETALIVGAGHVAQPLARLASVAGFRVLVVDDREEFLAAGRFPEAETRLVSFADLAAGVPLHRGTYAVIVTRSHQHDEQVLRQLLDKPLAYLGVIGSRRKVQGMFARLREQGFSAEQLARVRAPIGLDIGAQTPAEIALSVAAELVQVRRGGSGRPLSEVIDR